MSKCFPNLMKNIILHVHEAQPSHVNTNISTHKHIIVKMLKDKDKKNFESSSTKTIHRILISHQKQWGPKGTGMTYSKY